MTTLFTNAWILTMDDAMTEYRNGWLLTEDDRVADLGEGSAPAADETVDCRGGLLLPGFVNTHCHVSMVPFRSMGDDCPDRLRRFLFPLENEAMTPELVYLGARFGIAEMLRGGTTSFLDMYYFEDEVDRACADAGIRAWLGETVISQPTCDSPAADGGLRLAEEQLRRGPHGLITPVIAPHGTTTVSEAALREAHALAVRYDTLMTLHASEMDYEMKHFAERGMTPTGYLDSIGVLDEHLLAAHCIHLTEADVALLAARGVSVAHCIGSNTKAGKGVAPVKRLRDAGVTFGLGTDGPSSGNTLSMFDQLRLFAVCHKTANHDRGLFPAREIVYAATRGGAEALRASDRIGQLKPGMAADLQVVGTEGLHMFPVYNPYSALVYSANSGDVRHVMVNGRLLVRDGALTGTDIPALRERLTAAMAPFMAAAEKYRDIV